MIKILDDLKKNDVQTFNRVLQELDSFGQRSSKGDFNKYSFPQYLDFISFADSYSMQPDQYQHVMNVLDELNKTETDNLKLIRSSTPKQYKAIQKKLAVQSSRTRSFVIDLLKKYDDEVKNKPKTFTEALARFKTAFA